MRATVRLVSRSANRTAGRYWLGQVGQDISDEAILCVVQRKPILQIELHLHGARELTRYLLELLQSQGVSVRTWQDWLRQRESDPIRAAAAISLTQATTTRTAGILLDQYHGALRRDLERARAALPDDPDRARCEPWRAYLRIISGQQG